MAIFPFSMNSVICKYKSQSKQRKNGSHKRTSIFFFKEEGIETRAAFGFLFIK
jgi:hypothetical protein